MKLRLLGPYIMLLFAVPASHAQRRHTRATTTPAASPDPCSEPKVASPAGEYVTVQNATKDKKTRTVDFPTVLQTVNQALTCYQLLANKNIIQPAGLPKISSAALDFKTATATTTGFSLSVFIFKIGASVEKDTTNDVTFTYAPPKPTPPAGVHGITKPTPPSMFEQLVNQIEAASQAAQAQSTMLGLPLSKVQVQVAYGIKYDGNGSVSVPIQLVTLGPSIDHNKNNTQTITLTFGQ